MHILIKARNHLQFTPATGFVLQRKPSELDKLIEYCDNNMVTLPPTHALDYPLPANTDGVIFAGPDTEFIDSILRLVRERNVGALLAGMRDFILFPFVQENGCASLSQIVQTNSGTGMMDWYDGGVEPPRAPDGSIEHIETNSKEIFRAVTQAILEHPTCMPIMREGCTLLMLIYAMPTWFMELEKSMVVKVLIEARLNCGYELADNSGTHRVPQDMQDVLLAAQRMNKIEFDALEASCISMARDVAGLAPSFSPLDYHKVRPPNVTARGVHEHLWPNRHGKPPSW